MNSKSEVISRLLKSDLINLVNDYADFTSNLKILLAALEVTQEELAIKLKLEKTYVHRRVQKPDLWKLQEIKQVAVILNSKIYPSDNLNNQL